MNTRLRRLERQLQRDECSETQPCRNGGNCVDTYSGYFCQVHPVFTHLSSLLSSAQITGVGPPARKT